MRPCLLTLTLALAGLAAAAEPAEPPHSSDPLKSAECERALRRLQVQETQAAATPSAGPRADGRPRGPDARVQAARQHAAHVCLGSRADATPPVARLAQPPVAVPPVVSAAPPPRTPLPARPEPQPPARAQAPVVINSCDPTGCWASDGSRLNRMGPNLLGPRGLCTLQGSLLQCP